MTRSFSGAIGEVISPKPIPGKTGPVQSAGILLDDAVFVASGSHLHACAMLFLLCLRLFPAGLRLAPAHGP